MANLIAKAETDIAATPEQVWQTLTSPETVSKTMFGAQVDTDWRPGSPIVWRGDYDGTKFEDKGEILESDRPRTLSMTHFSPLSGKDDVPENYHTLVYTLDETDSGTHLSLTQDNNASEDEVEHSATNWQQVLSTVKQLAEQS